MVNREIFLLSILALASFGLFVLTRHVAAKERQLQDKIAAFWFEQGVQNMASNDTNRAIQSFRKATAEAGENRKYVLALATALAAANDNGEAERLLLQLRESDPQNPEINAALARLEAKDGSVQEAVRYYQNAIYGHWPAEASEHRRKLRIELVHLLIDTQQNNLAFSELLILQGSTPDSAAAHLELAQLFGQAGDPQRSFQEYLAAVRLDDSNTEALAGAGEAAFHLGDYAEAAQYLRLATQADPNSQKTKQLLVLSELVQNNDPLPPNLSSEQRQQRLLTDVDTSLKRLDTCLGSGSAGDAAVALRSLKTDAESLHKQLVVKSKPPDSDAVKSGVALIYKMEQAASQSCGQPEAEDQALLLIGRKHNEERR